MIAPLLESRPRRVLWTRSTPAFLNYLGARGYAVVSLFSDRTPPRGRWGVFVDGDEEPSLALFASRFPLMLIFGGPAAQRVLLEESERWPDGPPPLEQWRITARPTTGTMEPPPDGVTRIIRYHFAYDIMFAPSQTAE